MLPDFLSSGMRPRIGVVINPLSGGNLNGLGDIRRIIDDHPQVVHCDVQTPQDVLVALPGAAVYAGSKHAVEAVTDALRVELSPFGIRVIAVEPGSIDTEIWRKALERDERRADDEPGLRELYRPLISVLEKIDRDPRGIPPEMVAAVVHEALTDDSPRNRYLVGSDAKFHSRLRWLPDGLRDGMIRGKIWRE